MILEFALPKCPRADTLIGETMLISAGDPIDIFRFGYEELYGGFSIEEQLNLPGDFSGKLVEADYTIADIGFGEFATFWGHKILYDFTDKDGVLILSYPCTPLIEEENVRKVQLPPHRYRIADVLKLSPAAREANLDGFTLSQILPITGVRQLFRNVYQLEDPEKFYEHLRRNYDNG